MRYRDAKKGTENWSSQKEGQTLYASSSVRHQRGPKRQRQRRINTVAATGPRLVGTHERRQQPSSAVCWGLRECQHYPPSWVEAISSLDQVVSGSATPVSASQWNSCRTGSRAFAPGSRGNTRSVRNREQTRAFPVQEASKRTPFRTGRLPGYSAALNPAIPPIRAGSSCRCVRRCP